MSNNLGKEPKEFPLHQLVFDNDISGVSKLLNRHKEEEDFLQLKDCHGNTPLHLAVMLGHKECVQILVKHSHVVNVKNKCGWTALQESVSYGDRQTITSLFRALQKHNKKARQNQKPEICQALQSLGGDFYMEMRWDFQSWVPFVSRILPSDTCHIYRRGNQIRMDSTLEDFADRRWIHGDITYIINFDTDGEPAMVLMNNKKKVYQRMQQQTRIEKEASIEDEVDISMSSDIVDGSLKTRDLSISRVYSGWIFRHDKTETVGQFEADFYKISGLTLVTKKRREHLSDEDIRKNKSIRDAFSRGENTDALDDDDSDERRKSLPPPNGARVTWDEYMTSKPGTPPCLGRHLKEKTNQKTFEATLGISSDFPIKLKNLLPILEALGPKAKVFSKLRDFITLDLPPGFPVRIDVPILPTIKATVNFPQFEFRDNIPHSMFAVPNDYKEDPGWFEKSNKKK